MNTTYRMRQVRSWWSGISSKQQERIFKYSYFALSYFIGWLLILGVISFKGSEPSPEDKVLLTLTWLFSPILAPLALVALLFGYLLYYLSQLLF